ncbi:MAG: hypothetical protein LBJ19_01670 [Holosporaceae bacterium]|nr:hypothetical protein [Holosporaceae bacterium]
MIPPAGAAVTSTAQLHSALNKAYFSKYYSRYFPEDSANIMSEISYSNALSLSNSDLNLLAMQAHEKALFGNAEEGTLVINHSVKFWKRIRTLLGTFRNISIAATACAAGLYVWLQEYNSIIRNILESCTALSVALWEGCKYSEKRINTQMAQSNLLVILTDASKEKLKNRTPATSTSEGIPVSSLLPSVNNIEALELRTASHSLRERSFSSTKSTKTPVPSTFSYDSELSSTSTKNSDDE